MSITTALAEMLRRFYEETGAVPRSIELPRKVFMSIWSEAEARGLRSEWRPGFFTEGLREIDAGCPAIELETGHGRVRLIPDRPVYKRDLLTAAAKSRT